MNEKEFEKQQLEQLLNDLKDIDKYTSFKNGAFIYDLGKYQGSLLVNHINNLQSKIDKAIELGDKIIQEYEELVGLTGNLVLNFKQVLDILKENK